MCVPCSYENTKMKFQSKIQLSQNFFWAILKKKLHSTHCLSGDAPYKQIDTYQSCHDDKPSILHSSVSTVDMHLIDNDTGESTGNQITYYGGSICNLRNFTEAVNYLGFSQQVLRLSGWQGQVMIILMVYWYISIIAQQ